MASFSHLPGIARTGSAILRGLLSFRLVPGRLSRNGVLHPRRSGSARAGMPRALHKLAIMTFPRLLSHIDIGPVRAENRIVFPAHRTNLAGKGWVSRTLIHYYVDRARGGCGLVIIGKLTVHPNDRPYSKRIWNAVCRWCWVWRRISVSPGTQAIVRS